MLLLNPSKTLIALLFLSSLLSHVSSIDHRIVGKGRGIFRSVSSSFHLRSLEDFVCDDTLEGWMAEDYLSMTSHECICDLADIDDHGTNAICVSKAPSECFELPCMYFDCGYNTTDPEDFVEVCYDLHIETFLKTYITYDSFYKYFNAQENRRDIVVFYTKGVDNVCEIVESLHFHDDTGSPPSTCHHLLECPGVPASGCHVLLDEEMCQDCSICEQEPNTWPYEDTNYLWDPDFFPKDHNVAGGGSVTRSFDCSNIFPDAVDSDCIVDDDDVHFQVLKYNASATCTRPTPPPTPLPTPSPEPTKATSGGSVMLVNRFVMVHIVVLPLIWQVVG